MGRDCMASKDIEDIFMKLIYEVDPKFKPTPVKYTYKGTKTFEEIFEKLILDEAKESGYYI